MRFFIIIMGIAIGNLIAVGADTNIENIVKSGIATRDELDTLTTNDIPKNFRVRVESENVQDYTKKVYFRGDQKILEVMWRTNCVGSMSNMFVATIYDGTNKIGKVSSFSDGMVNFMQPRNTRNDYDMITSIKTNGLAKLMFSNDKGYLQIIELKGRETGLMNDLEYTKSTTLIEDVGKPLVEAIKNDTKKSPEK
jgi:hypothetical protein